MKRVGRWIAIMAGVVGVIGVTLITPWQVAAESDTSDPPRAAALLLNQVHDLMNRKDYGRAIEKLTAFQAKADGISPRNDPTGCRHPMVYFVLGNCHLLKTDYSQAQVAFEKALAQRPDFVEAWLNLASAHYEQKAYGQAARCWNEAYQKSNQEHPEYLYYSATAYLMTQQRDLCLAAFDRLFKNHPGQVERSWRENHAHALMAADRHRQALPVVRALVDLESEKASQWREVLLQLYLQLEMPDQALKVALDLARNDCANTKWWKALAHVHLSGKRYREALAAMTICSYLTPLSGEEQKLMADLSLQLDIPAKAVPVYEAILTQKPDKPILQNLIAAYRRMDRPQQALNQLERYASSGSDAEILMLKGDLLFSLKRFDEAGGAYRQAAQAGVAQAGQAWLMAGYAAWQLNDIGASRHAFEKAAQYSQNRKAAQQAMAQLPRS